jgi:phosphate transport system substrate-binding protein
MNPTPTVFGALLLASFCSLAAGAKPGPAPGTPAREIHGAGASFASALYKSWADSYGQAHGVKVSYLASGSGEGVRRIVARSVDFGASDTPLAPADLDANALVQIPVAVGGIVPVIHVRGIANDHLRLTGDVLADIMRGAITQWNDRRIAALNPDIILPGAAIMRIVRSDRSGSSEAFTRYLSAVSPEWKTQVGAGQRVKWPGVVITAEGNDGEAAAVAATPYAIGYVSFDRVASRKLAAVRLRNRAGAFVAPSPAGFKSAAQESDLSRRGDETASLLDQPGIPSWPLTMATYLLLDARPKTAAGARDTLQFVWWSLLNGDAAVRANGLTPPPAAFQGLLVQRFARIHAQDGQALNFFAN